MSYEVIREVVFPPLGELFRYATTVECVVYGECQEDGWIVNIGDVNRVREIYGIIRVNALQTRHQVIDIAQVWLTEELLRYGLMMMSFINDNAAYDNQPDALRIARATFVVQAL